MSIIKLVFAIGVLLLLVLMGVYNRTPVDFNLPPLVHSVVKQPAALMYFAFFAIGVLTGAVLTLRRSKPASAPPSSPK
jgi:uncharacterized integral membrane protein